MKYLLPFRDRPVEGAKYKKNSYQGKLSENKNSRTASSPEKKFSQKGNVNKRIPAA